MSKYNFAHPSIEEHCPFGGFENSFEKRPQLCETCCDIEESKMVRVAHWVEDHKINFNENTRKLNE